jgi:sec-independent protein translocase protein TatB
MFDIGASELLIVGVVALVVIGPKELPGVLRSVGRTVGKIRTMAGEFQAQFSDALREAEMEETRKKVAEMGESVKSAFEDPLKPAEPATASSAESEINAASTPDLAPPLPEPASVNAETLAADLGGSSHPPASSAPSSMAPPHHDIAAASSAQESAPPKAAGHSAS